MFKKLFFNTFTGYGVIFVRMIIGLIAIPFYIKHLGVDLYGFMILIISTIGITTVLDFGLEEGMVKYLSETRAKKDKELLNSYFNTFILLYSIIAVLIILFGFIFYYLLPGVFKINQGLMAYAPVVIMIVTAETCISFIFKSFKGVLLSYGRYDITNSGNAGYTLLNNALGILMVYLGFGIIGIVLSRLFAALLREVFFCYKAYQLETFLSLQLHYIDKSKLLPIFSFSFYVFLGSASGIMVRNFDITILGIFLPIYYVTAYDIILKLIDSLMDIAFQIYSSLFALNTELKDSNNFDGIKKLYLTTTKIMFSLASVIALFILVYLGPLVDFFSDQQISITPEIYTLTALCTLERLIFITHAPSISVLLTLGKHKLCGISSIITAIINLATKGFSVKFLGFIGVFLNNIIPTVIVQLLIINLYQALKLLNISFKTYLSITLQANMLAISIVTCFYFSLHHFFPTKSILIILLQGFLGGILYLVLFYLSVLSKEEQTFIKGKTLQLLHR